MRRPGCVRSGACVWPLLVSLLAGCTMCPDPYDYSGPVPDGAATQNDFRARSNGIIPIGAAPRPWPPIVRSERAGEDVPGSSAEEQRIAQAPAAGEVTRIPEVVAEEPLDIAAAFESADSPPAKP
ncbi:MAG: hypothetical protein ACKOCX_09620 [Planctomycetota bacterium]